MINVKNIENFYNQNIKASKGKYILEQVADSNLYTVISDDGSFGILLASILSEFTFPKYRNILIIQKSQIIDQANKTVLKNCCLLVAKKEIDKSLFQKVFTQFLENKKNQNFFKISDVKKLLQQLSKITSIEIHKKEEVIGIFGELVFLYDLLKKSDKNENMKKILQSWESENSRTIIDFNFDYCEVKVEVKTTSTGKRYHHILDLSQIICDKNQEGFLASICIVEDKNGKSNATLVKEISALLMDDSLKLFNQKLELRGVECKNNKYHFVINNELPLLIYNFNDVPKPISNEHIDKISWNVNLDNINKIEFKSYERTLKKIIQKN